VTIPQLPRGLPIVDDKGVMTDRFTAYTQEVGRLNILTGSGTPEAAVESVITSLYMDTAGTVGSILYIKRDADIAGDRTKGWIMV